MKLENELMGFLGEITGAGLIGIQDYLNFSYTCQPCRREW